MCYNKHKMHFEKFNPESPAYFEAITIVGPAACGKTSLAKDLLSHMQASHTIVITGGTKSEYSDIVPSENIYDNYKEAIVSGIVDKQHTCIVFDNCWSDSTWTRDSAMKQLIFNGRCLKVKCIVVLEQPAMTDIPVSLCVNTDYAFIFRIQNRKSVYERYGLVFPTLEKFNEALDEITKEPHACMVINNTSAPIPVEEKVMWYKAT